MPCTNRVIPTETENSILMSKIYSYHICRLALLAQKLAKKEVLACRIEMQCSSQIQEDEHSPLCGAIICFSCRFETTTIFVFGSISTTCN